MSYIFSTSQDWVGMKIEQALKNYEREADAWEDESDIYLSERMGI